MDAGNPSGPDALCNEAGLVRTVCIELGNLLWEGQGAGGQNPGSSRLPPKSLPPHNLLQLFQKPPKQHNMIFLILDNPCQHSGHTIVLDHLDMHLILINRLFL